jgi:hypothetical protein
VRRAVVVAVVMLGAWAPAALATSITYTLAGTGANGWYRTSVTVTWYVDGLPNGPCGGPVTVDSETFGTQLTCSFDDGTGPVSKTTTPIRIDKTAPSAGVGADRPADSGGFYNHPLTVTWTGTDARSGIDSCTKTPYAGPDGMGVSLMGTCTDMAGNVSAAVPFALNYDATAPQLDDVIVKPTDAGARLTWQASGASRITVTRSSGAARVAQTAVVYDGTGNTFTDAGLRNGAKYTYVVQAMDAAGNATSDAVQVTPNAAASTEHLLSPGFQSKVSRAPMLRWREIRRASYYNVQLFRKGKKILSAWPTKPHYQLHKVWTYRGKRHRLMPGTYWWYLWAGYGHRSEHRYGKLLGRRSFTVA